MKIMEVLLLVNKMKIALQKFYQKHDEHDHYLETLKIKNLPKKNNQYDMRQDSFSIHHV